MKKYFDFLRVPEETPSLGIANMEITGKFALVCVVFSGLLAGFYSIMHAIAVGAFLTFIVMFLAELTGGSKRIYPLKKYNIIVARIALLPLIATTLWAFFRVIPGGEANWELVVASAGFSMISLQCLSHAKRRLQSVDAERG
jgi:hypothetical protein